MNLSVNTNGGVPLYEQIYNQIKRQILEGKLKEGEMLPTIRSLAKDLRISVITTSRAYGDLERDGFIHTVVGKGSFVAPRNAELFREETLKKAEEKFAEGIELYRIGGMSDEEILESVNILLRG